MGITLDFKALEQEFGAETQERVFVNGMKIKEAIWSQEAGSKLISHCAKLAEQHSEVELVGHTQAWVMLSILYELRRLKLTSRMGAASIPIEPYCLGGQPTYDQPVNFDITGRDQSIHIQVRTLREVPINEMRFSSMHLPQIAQQKNIFLENLSLKLFPLFGIPSALGEKCRTLNVKCDGIYRCAVSHTDSVSKGDIVASPFQS